MQPAEATRYVTVDAEDIGAMLRAICLDGCCFELALAVSQATGLPMVGLWDPAFKPEFSEHLGCLFHAGVRLPDGRLLDARGPIQREVFAAPFAQPLTFVESVSEADLRAIRPIESSQIILRMAMVLWPDLPWRPEIYLNRVARFTAALATLSRLHGVWVRAPVPASRPILTDAHGDETGYDVEVHGIDYTIDRQLGPATD